MTERINQIKDFLARNNIEFTNLIKIAGDASFRSYFRILSGNSSYIIMDAPVELEDITGFCKIDNFLIQNNFSAPNILRQDFENGFLLLEDFSDDSYSRILRNCAESELEDKELYLYQKAVDVLLELHKIEPEIIDLPEYNQELLLKEVSLFTEWYLPHILKKPASAAQINLFKESWLAIFQEANFSKKIVLRDYHADNLFFLGNRKGCKMVGLLDFQDAVIGSAAYDLVSLLEDARRDVSELVRQKMIQHYLFNAKCDKDSFLREYSILSLQRNIKIVGIFSRLAIRDKKPEYLKLLSRVFGFINSRLKDKIFIKIQDNINSLITQNA